MRISSFYLAVVMTITLILACVAEMYNLNTILFYTQFWWVLLLPILSKVLFPYSKFTKFINKKIFTNTFKKF